MAEQIRPTKKQRELLTYIEAFITEHGYSPSYREVMNGLGYTSVASVALHINSLIKRGHLRKRDRSARSLEVVKGKELDGPALDPISDAQEKWLVKQINFYFDTADKSKNLTQRQLDELYVLVGALRVLGLEGAAQSFLPKLAQLKERLA